MSWFELLERCTWATTLILLAAYAANWSLRAAPAAWRHFLWTATLAALILLPVVVRWMPAWKVTAPPMIATPVDTLVVQSGPMLAAAPSPSAWSPIFLVWLAGCAVVTLRFLAGRMQVARIVRHSVEAVHARGFLDAAGGRGVPVVESAYAHTALALGIFRPVVVLPVNAGEWPPERLQSTLLHELMHVRRRDLLAQAIAQSACCLYWFHPLTWMAARQLRREREQACDNAVLGRGVAAQEYAGHLVESARALRGRQSQAVAMLEPSELEIRVRALLDGTRDRRPLNRATAYGMVMVLLFVLMPVAAITVHAQSPVVALLERDAVPVEEQPIALIAVPEPAPQAAPPAPALGILSGIIQDPSGARVPNCSITITSEDGSLKERTTTTDAAGGYQFAGLPVGKYSIQVSAPGFRKYTRKSLPVQNSQNPTVISLALGGVTEAVTITAARPETVAVPVATLQQPQRVRVGGMVQPAKILYKAPPVYPEQLRAQGISGTVQLSAIISKQGFVQELRAVSGPVDLIPAAMEAASHWVYQPSLLNGEPVAVETTIDIIFELK